MALHEFLPPRVDLLVDVDLDRTDVAAAAVERRRERQVAVFVRIEGRIDDQADRARISCPVAQATAAAIDRAGVHAGAATDAFERGPELLKSETRRAAVVHQHHMHFAAPARTAEMRR